MEALLMLGVVLATVAAAAFCKDCYDDDERGPNGSCASSGGNRRGDRNSHNSRGSIDDYHRHSPSRTQKLR